MAKKSLNLVSWNVNGIRAVLKKGFLEFMESESPDVISIQETKAWKSQVDLDLQGYHSYWHEAKKKGYSGTAVYSKIEPCDVRYGIDDLDEDEGRVITCEYEQFFLVNVYTPNSKRGLTRLEYRQFEWDKKFLEYILKLEQSKPVVLCGDLNVSHKEIDLANPAANRKNAGFTDEERAGFEAFLTHGFSDTFRMFNSEGGHYTWWSYRPGIRERNIGWRLDYFLVSQELVSQVHDARILSEVLGSDHCPVSIDLVLSQ